MIHLDKTGCFFEVNACREEDIPSVLEMYDDFSPKGRFQGMPPWEKQARDVWVKHLLADGESFLAWRGGKVIGHVTMLPDFNMSNAEFLIFVHQFDRGKGVGTALTRTAVRRARERCLKMLWLTVHVYNFRATRLYRKFGFEFCDDCRSGLERKMSCCCELKNDS